MPVDGSQTQEWTRVYWAGVPRRGKRGTLSLRGTALKRRLRSLEVAPGSNLPEEMGGIEDLAAEIRTAGLSVDDRMLYIIFVDALPAEF